MLLRHGESIGFDYLLRIIHITVNKHYIFNRVKSESETSVDSNCSVDSDAAASDTRHDNRGAGVRGASGVRGCRGRGRGRG